MKKKWLSDKRKRILSFILGGAIILTSPAVGARAFEQVDIDSDKRSTLVGNSAWLGNSDDEGISLGDSDKEILFQFQKHGSVATNDLVIELAIVGDVRTVKMVDPKGKEDLQAIPDSEPLGSSREEIQEAVTDDKKNHTYSIEEKRLFTTEDVVDSVEVEANESLGYTDELILEVEDNKTLETDSKVDFPMESTGLYDFRLYNADDEWLGTLKYNLRTALPGEIVLEPIGNFQIIDTVQMKVDYLPTAGHAGEKLYIILPPFFKLGSIPQGQSDITFKKSTIDFPKAHYESEEYGDILLTYAENNPTKAKVDVLEATLDSTVTNEIALTLTMTLAVAEKRELSALMVLYGENPDKIPLKTIAESRKLDETLLDTVVFTGTSVLTDPTGSTPVENLIIYPNGAQTTPSIASYRRAPLHIYNGSNLSHPKFSAPHYPFTNVYQYVPHIEGAQGIPATAIYREINGRKYVGVPASTSSYYNTYYNENPNYGVYAKVFLPNVGGVKPQETIELGPIYMGYTYKGVEYFDVETTLSNLVVQNALRITQAIQFKNASGAFEDSYGARRQRVQGKQNEIYRINVRNEPPAEDTSATSPYVPLTYQDPTITFSFPYEISPNKVSYTTGTNIYSHFVPMQPTSATYTTWDDQSGTVPVLTTTNEIDLTGITGNVKTLALKYDLLLYNTILRYDIDADNGTEDINGTTLGDKKTVFIISEITTPDGKRIELYDADEPVPVNMPVTRVSHIVDLVGLSDGLRFGTLTATASTTYEPKGSNATQIRAVGETYTYRNAGISGVIDGGRSPWVFGFKTSIAQSKDYEDVVIRVDGATEADKKALSKVVGLQSPYKNGYHSSGGSIYYTTNLDSNERSIMMDNINSSKIYYFDLADGEYVTGFEIRLGTLYGEGLSHAVPSYDRGEVVYSTTARFLSFTPQYEDSGYYFLGSAKQEEIKDKDQSNLVATVSTSSPAQFVTPNPEATDFNNNKSTNTTTFTTYKDVTMVTPITSSLSSWNKTTFYQDETFKVFLNTYPSFQTVGGSAFVQLGTYPSYDRYVHLEVAKGFDITNIAGHERVSAVELPGRNTILYTYKSSADNIPNNITVEGYILPDATVGSNITVVENVAYSYDPFVENYLQPASGEDAYYLKAPHYKWAFRQSNTNRIPTEWGIVDSDATLFAPVTSGNKVNVNRANVDRITLNAIVSGVNQNALGIYEDHQKTELTVYGWMTNVSASVIPSYKATFNLPRKGVDTQGAEDLGVTNWHKNAYDLTLSGPVTLNKEATNLQIIYYNGTQVIDPVVTGWDSVTSVEMTFDEFAGNDTYQAIIPLETEYQKVGTEVADILAYVGASSSKKTTTGGEFGIPVFTTPASFNFKSYVLSMRMGEDTYERGQFYTTLASGRATVRAYYQDENDVEQELTTRTSGTAITIPMNADATRLVATPTDPTMYMLTVPKKEGLAESANSDFPRDGSLNINMDDLINKRTYLYDASFIRVPRMTIYNTNLRVGNTTTVSPGIYYPAGGNAANIANYGREFSETVTPEIATISTTGDVLANKKGTTTYTYTITNLLGDVFTQTGTIVVTPNYVPTANLTKTLAENSHTIGGTFSFTYWAENPLEADNGLGSAKTVVGVTVNGVRSISNTLETGIKHHIKETPTLAGYEIDNFVVTSNGSVDVPVERGDDNDFTFIVPADSTSIVITAVNKNSNVTMDLEKQMAIGELPNTEDFDITIKENTTNHVVYSSSPLKADGTVATVDTFVKGMSYTVSEAVPANYELSTVKILNSAGNLTAVQPTRVNSTSFQFSLQEEHFDGKIIVENKLLKGNGLVLTKELEANNLPAETFAFTLSGSNGYAAYGKVNAASYPATVDWFSDTEGTTPISVATLPVGTYTLTENTAALHNFQLSGMRFTAGVAAAGSTATESKFTVTTSSAVVRISATNEVKTQGSVLVMKTLDTTDFNADSITFTLTHQPSGTVYTSTQVVDQTGKMFEGWIKAGTETPVYTNNLPMGQYTLTESDSGEHFDFAGFKLAEYGAGSTYELSPDGKTATFSLSLHPDYTDSPFFMISALNDLKKGSVTITKQVTGELNGATQDFNFHLYKYGTGDPTVDTLIGDYTITVAEADVNLSKTITIADLPFGQYYVVEELNDEFIILSTSSVVEEGKPVNPAVHVKTHATVGADFMAINRLKTATKGLMVHTVAKDASLVSTENTFNFELVNYKGTVLYTGTVPSTEAGIDTTPGAPAVWTARPGVTNGALDGSATTITGLDFGSYTIRETLVGADFRPVEVTGTIGLGSASNSTTYQMIINKSTEELAENAVTFVSERRYANVADLTKGFTANGTNFREKTFAFDYWRTSVGVSDKTRVTGVDETATTPVILEKGQEYKIAEVNTPLGYVLDSVEVTSNSVTTPAIAVVKESGDFKFTVPNDATEVHIVAVNDTNPITLNVKKVVEDNEAGVLTSQTFPISVREAEKAESFFSSSNFQDGSVDTITTFVAGVSYIIEETVPNAFMLHNVTVVDSTTGVPVGLQPQSVDAGSFGFTLDASQADATILVTNKLRVGNGLTLYKQVEATNLTGEEFLFELKGPNSYIAYGKIEATSTSPSLVQWYSDIDRTVTTSVTTLPVGTYAVTETSSNVNYLFDKFTVSTGATTENAGGELIFTVTDGATPSEAIAATVENKAIRTGRVVVNKVFDTSNLSGDTFTFTLTNKATGDTYTAQQTVSANAGNVTASGLEFSSWVKTNGGTTHTNDLPMGEYTLTETSSGTNYTWSGFDTDPEGYITLENGGLVATFKLSAEIGSKTEVDLTANNNILKDTLTIRKYMNNSMGGTTPYNFTFHVYRVLHGGTVEEIDANGAAEGNAVTIAYPTNKVGSYVDITVPNLPYGDYYVTEELDPLFVLTNSSDVTEPIVSGAVPTTKTLAGPVTFVAQNKLKLADENFIVWKKVDAASGIPQNNFTFELTDTTTNTVLYRGVLSNNDPSITTGVPVKWEKVGVHEIGTLVFDDTQIEGLLYGSYSVRETSAGPDYTLSAIAGREDLGQALGTDGWAFTLDNTNSSLDDFGLDFTNKVKESGSVVVSKNFAGNVNPFPEAAFTFVLTNDDTGVRYNGTATGTQPVNRWTRQGDGTVVENGTLPLGTYTVTENSSANYTLEGFAQVGASNTGAASLTVGLHSGAPTATIEATNKVKADGRINLTKGFENGYNHDATVAFEFSLFGPAVDGVFPTSPSDTLVVKGDNNWTITAENLTYGAYQLVEEARGGYEFVSMTNGITTVLATDGMPKPLDFIIGEEGGQQQTTTVSAQNRVASNGVLDLSTIVEGELGIADQSFQFKITNPLGAVSDVAVKANDTTIVENLLLGDYKVTFVPDENYEFVGYGEKARRAELTAPTVSLSEASLRGAVKAINKAKTDGELTVSPEFIAGTDPTGVAKKFSLQIWASYDNGETWVIPSGKQFGDVTLEVGETHTYSELTRSVLYKVTPSKKPVSPYSVVDITVSGKGGEVDIEQESMTFRPLASNLAEKGIFVHDFRKMDIQIYKYISNWGLGFGLENARFRVYAADDVARQKQLFLAITDENGKVTIPQLLEGDYVIEEYFAPRHHKILQKEVIVSIRLDETAGDLVATISNSPLITIEGNVLSVPNEYIPPIKNDSGTNIQDTDNNLPAGQEEQIVEGVHTEEMPNKPTGVLPNAGGIPLGYVALLGGLFLGLGGILRKKEKKNEK